MLYNVQIPVVFKMWSSYISLNKFLFQNIVFHIKFNDIIKIIKFMHGQCNSTCFSGDASCIIMALRAAHGEVDYCNTKCYVQYMIPEWKPNKKTSDTKCLVSRSRLIALYAVVLS